MRICSSCNTRQDHEFSFCKMCGARLPSVTAASIDRKGLDSATSPEAFASQGVLGLCARCDHLVDSGSRFCEHCGADVATGRRTVKHRFGWPEGVCGVLAMAWFVAWVLWSQYGFEVVLLGVPQNAELLVDGKTNGAGRSSDEVVRLRLSRGLHMVTVRAPGFEPWSRWVKAWTLESKREVRVSLYRSLECADLALPTGYRVAAYVPEGHLLQPVLAGRGRVSQLCGPVGGKAYALITPVDTTFFVPEPDPALIAEADFGSGKRKGVQIRRYRIRSEADKLEAVSPGADVPSPPEVPQK